MPCHARLELPNIPLHVIQRGVNRGAIVVDDEDRHHFLDLLHEASREHDLHIHAYVLMGNHVHLLLTPKKIGTLSSAMRRFGQCYVQAFNLRHRRVGPLWQGRFKSCLVESDAYLMTVYRYIELNPVRAAMTERAEDSPSSSVHANLASTPIHSSSSTHFSWAFTAILSNALRPIDWLREEVNDDDLLALRLHLQRQRALGGPTFQAMVERSTAVPLGSALAEDLDRYARRLIKRSCADPA